MAKITVVPLFKNRIIGTQGVAGTGLSDAVDLQEISSVGNFSLSYTLATTGGSATAGSSKFEYLGCPTFDGSYMALGTFGTQGAVPLSSVVSFSPVTIPFMKIKAVTGTSNALKLTAELNVR